MADTVIEEKGPYRVVERTECHRVGDPAAFPTHLELRRFWIQINRPDLGRWIDIRGPYVRRSAALRKLSEGRAAV